MSGCCPRCERPLTEDGHLRYCDRCGYEPPESAALPVTPPPFEDAEDSNQRPPLDDRRSGRVAARPVMDLLTIRAGGFTATVDGCARGGNELWFLSMLGHQQAVRAIWARLIKGEAGYLDGTDLGEPTPLAPEAWGTWRFTGMRLPSGSAYHGMLIPEIAAYATDRPDFLLLVREQDDAAQLHFRFLTRRLELPLHPSWADWLWQRGLENGEVEQLDSKGLSAYRCSPRPEELRADISHAVRRRALVVETTRVADVELKAA